MEFPVKEINKTDKNFPELLKDIPDPVDTLYYKGKLDFIQKPVVAVVGTRKATPQGLEASFSIAKGLAEAGIVVISGLALGVDGAAHEGALEGNGVTVAVLGHGLDIVYPKNHESLAERILESGGALLSEYPEGIQVRGTQFLKRNRIISGLALGVVIVEAPLRSGTISTAHHGLEQGRDIFVVPGPAHHSNYLGAHKLIRDGARLVTSADEIISDLERQLDEYRSDKLRFN